ncbi:MAG TPA: hypothetical protein VM842_05005 [Nitrospira sp.]|jgi:hypothetical protein|nr:hypothetical protein [Nitrospira sp.]
MAVGRRATIHVCALALAIFFTCPSQAQVMGEEAELNRLRAKAEEAMGNEDAEGAAMNMGRAALMAAQLSKRYTDPVLKQTYSAAEHLYRSQEHGYRAVALFRRAGGELPASAGVCGSLQLGQLELNHVQTALDPPQMVPDEASRIRMKPLQEAADDWAIVLGSMRAEYHCPS